MKVIRCELKLDKEFSSALSLVISVICVTFNVIGANSLITAKVYGQDVNTGTNVIEGKNIEFIASPNSGFKVKEWKLSDAVAYETGNTYTLINLQSNVIVTVEFGPDNSTVNNGNNTGNPGNDEKIQAIQVMMTTIQEQVEMRL
jgi:hypothetical protein